MRIRKDCPSCGAEHTVTERLDITREEIHLPNGQVAEMHINGIPVMSCNACDFEWYDDRGESAIQAAMDSFFRHMRHTDDPAFKEMMESNNEIH